MLISPKIKKLKLKMSNFSFLTKFYKIKSITQNKRKIFVPLSSVPFLVASSIRFFNRDVVRTSTSTRISLCARAAPRPESASWLAAVHSFRLAHTRVR